MQSIADEYLSKIKIKVTRDKADGRRSLCGEPFNENEQCFWIPAHQADYIKTAQPKYIVHAAESKTNLPQGDPIVPKAKETKVYESPGFAAMEHKAVMADTSTKKETRK
jgi:hypothetical protein